MSEYIEDIIKTIPGILDHNIKNDLSIDLLNNDITDPVFFQIKNIFYKFDKNFLINYWKLIEKDLQFKEIVNDIPLYEKITPMLDLYNFPLQNFFINNEDIQYIYHNNDINMFVLKLEKKDLRFTCLPTGEKINYCRGSKLYKIDKKRTKKNKGRGGESRGLASRGRGLLLKKSNQLHHKFISKNIEQGCRYHSLSHSR